MGGSDEADEEVRVAVGEYAEVAGAARVVCLLDGLFLETWGDPELELLSVRRYFLRTQCVGMMLRCGP